ncbi:MAG: hypothetical protein QG614_236 [Patescibacteria group bacterium]|nr:hypothetical protein [Patescibacteria group bacterium]
MVMTKEQIEGYIKGSIESGISTADIKNNLVMLGVGPSDVDVYLNKTQAPMMPNMEPINPIPPTPSFQGMPKPPVLPTHKKSKLIKLFASFIFVFLILAGGAYAYVGFVVSTDKITNRALKEVTKVKSASFDTLITIGDTEGLPDELKDGGNKVVYSGNYDFHNETNLKASFKLAFSLQGISASIEARMLGDKIYGQLIKAPDFFLLPSLSQHENKWYYMSVEEDLKDNFLAPSLGSMLSIENIYDEDITEEQKLEIKRIFENSKFIKILKKDIPKIQNNKLMYHMEFELDYEGIISYLKDVFAYIESQKKEELRDVDVEEFETLFRDNIKSIKNFKGELWINSIDGLPYKVLVNFDLSYDGLGSMNNMHITIDSNFKDWNEDIQIEVPQGAIDFKEVTGDNYGFGLEAARKKGIDEALKSDLSYLRLSAEMYYENNRKYSGVCESNEVQNIFKNASEQGVFVACNATDSSYSVYSELKSGETYCVDSTGYAGISSPELNDVVCGAGQDIY